MITQRAYLLGVVAFCFYLIAIVNDLPPFYYLLTWLSVGVLASSFGIALLSLMGLECRWNVAQAHATESCAEEPDEPTLHGPRLEVELENTGTLNKTGVLIDVILRPAPAKSSTAEKGASRSTLQGRANSPSQTRRFLLEALPSGEAVRTELVLRDLHRGRYYLEELRLVGSDVLGLFRVRRRVYSGADLAPADVVVGPATLSRPGAPSELFQQSAREGRGPTRMSGQSSDVRATRPYAPGDDLRHVHWKTTARTSTLVVKEFERSTERAPCMVIWDGAASARWGDGSDSSTEWGLRLTASLHRGLLEAGLQCGVLCLDATPQMLGLGEVPSAASISSRVIEMLADADADRQDALSLALRSHLPTLSQQMDVYIVTASLSPDIAGVAQQLRSGSRRVSVGLINGALLQERAAISFWQRSMGGEQVESWPATGSGAAGQTPVTEASYQETAQKLRTSGIPTVLVPQTLPASPTPVTQTTEQAAMQDGSGGCAKALRLALDQLLSSPEKR